jgi:hypothetical protein
MKRRLGESARMRDKVLEESLKRLAAETSTRFSALVATGDEIPFDVAENDGESSHFYRYVPLTGGYVESRFEEVRSLPSYGPARGAVVAAGVSATFLESKGIQVPADPAARADEMIRTFISELWEGASEFSLNLSRIESILDEIEVESRDIREADVLMVPLAGFEMTLDDVEFSNGTRIVRAGSIEAPVEAISSEGTDRNAWQPACLATVPLGSGPESPREALGRISDLVMALRLAKDGCVGIGPHAFAPVGDGAWRRIETGATPARSGTFLLLESDLDLADELLGLIGRGAVQSAGMGFAIKRFCFGLERSGPMEAISDHLLAVRAAVTGETVIDTPAAVRAAALIGEFDDGSEGDVRNRMEAAFELEEALIAGGSVTSVRGESATYLAAWVEDSVRGMIRRALLGEFGTDLNVTAEEILITEGLGSGEGSISQMGSSEEWGDIPHPVSCDPVPDEGPVAEVHVLKPREDSPIGGASRRLDPDDIPTFDTPVHLEGEDSADRILTPMPEIEAALGISRDSDGHLPGDIPELLLEPQPGPGEITVSAPGGIPRPSHARSTGSEPRDWLDEARQGVTMEWPAVGHVDRIAGSGDQSERPADRFFPPVGETEWKVSELDYPRRRGA